MLRSMTGAFIVISVYVMLQVASSSDTTSTESGGVPSMRLCEGSLLCNGSYLEGNNAPLIPESEIDNTLEDESSSPSWNSRRPLDEYLKPRDNYFPSPLALFPQHKSTNPSSSPSTSLEKDAFNQKVRGLVTECCPCSEKMMREEFPPNPVIIYDRVSSHLPVPSTNKFLIIPGRRQRPLDSKVRVLARNKVREVKFTTSPLMSVMEALRQAETKVQYQYPELRDQKVIVIESEEDVSPGTICYRVTRIGKVSEDDSHFWMIKVFYSDTRSDQKELVYEGRCIPGNHEVIVRPSSTIDLVLTSKSDISL